MIRPGDKVRLLFVCTVLLVGRPARASHPTSVVLYDQPGEIHVDFSITDGGYRPTNRFQITDTPFIWLNWEAQRAGDFPSFADDTTMLISRNRHDRVWTIDLGPDLGGGFASDCCGGGGVGANWNETDSAGLQVPTGRYWAGIEFTQPHYPFPNRTDELLRFEIIDGSWVFKHSFQDLGASAIAVAAGDLNGDGYVDLIFRATQDYFRNEVFWNNGDGTFRFGYAFHAGDAVVGRWTFQIADLDRDGDLDLVEVFGASFSRSSYSEDAVYTYLNDGSGVFDTPTHAPYFGELTGFGDGASLLALGYVNGDQYVDAVVTFPDVAHALLFLNDGTGNLIQSNSIPTEMASTPLLADLDANGTLDLVVGHVLGGPSVGISVFLGDGAGHFVDGGQLGDSQASGLGLVDYDGDGLLDVIGSTDSSPLVVWQNHGAARFGLAYALDHQQPGYDRALALAVGDVDRDGLTDVVAGGGPTWLYENRNHGRLRPLADPLLMAVGLVLADVDNDGDLDLITAGGGDGHRNYVYYNTTRSPGCGP